MLLAFHEPCQPYGVANLLRPNSGTFVFYSQLSLK